MYSVFLEVQQNAFSQTLYNTVFRYIIGTHELNDLTLIIIGYLVEL